MILPGVLSIVSPIIIGVLLGAEALGGMLGGSLTTGVLLAIFIALGYILYMIDKVIKGKNKSNWFLVKTYYFHLQK